MAEKRSLEETEALNCKKIKQLDSVELMDDVVLDKTEILPDLKFSLEYDPVLRIFAFGIEKKRDEGDRCISVGEEELNNMIKLLPTLVKVSDRYTSKRSPRLIDIPLEASSAETGDLVTLISLKENMYKRGQFDIDLRKCVKKEDGGYRYTSEGVRFSITLVAAFQEILLRYQSLISKVEENTKAIMVMAAAHAVISEIMELIQCPGCKIDHPSQDQHMGTDGCLKEEEEEEEEKMAWDKTVHQYWQAAWCLVEEEPLQELARQTIQSHESFQVCGLYYIFIFFPFEIGITRIITTIHNDFTTTITTTTLYVLFF